MKTRTCVSILILVLAVLVISEGYATDKKVTMRDYSFFLVHGSMRNIIHIISRQKR